MSSSIPQPSSPTLPKSFVVIEGDSKLQFAIDLDSHFRTARSIIFLGHSLPAASPVIVKLSRTNLAQVASTLDEAQTIFTLLSAAIASHNEEPESAFVPDCPTREGCHCSNDDLAGSCVHEVKIHANLHAHHAAHPEKLACVVLALDTLASGEAIVLPRHRPLQPDFRTPQMPLAEVARLATDLVQALTTVHDAGYVHCDVSVGNVVIACDECDKDLTTLGPKDDSPRCPHVAATQPAVEKPPRRYRLIDFGLCQKIDDTNAVTSACGTPGFVAPEILQVPPATIAEIGPSSALGIPNLQLDAQESPQTVSQPQVWQLSASPSLIGPSEPVGDSNMDVPVDMVADHGACWGRSFYSPSEVSSLDSGPPSDHTSMFSDSAEGNMSSPRLLSTRGTTQSPTGWHDLRFRLSAARDVYSVGIVVGLVLSGYLPLCDADHLGCQRSSPDYVRSHIIPRLRVFRKVLAENGHLVPPGAFQVLDWSVDFVLRCLAYSPRARTPAKKLLRRHPLCEWVLGTAPTFHDVAVPVCMVDPATWRRSASYTILKDAMEERRDDWEVASQFEMDGADAVAEAADYEHDDDDETSD